MERDFARIPRQGLGVSLRRSLQSFCLIGRRGAKQSPQVAETAHVQSVTSLQPECNQTSFFSSGPCRSTRKFSTDVFSKPTVGLVKKGFSPVAMRRWDLLQLQKSSCWNIIYFKANENQTCLCIFCHGQINVKIKQDPSQVEPSDILFLYSSPKAPNTCCISFHSITKMGLGKISLWVSWVRIGNSDNLYK